MAPKHIEHFNSISLEEMNAVALMKRTDTKFLLHKEQLAKILAQANHHYDILAIDDNRLMSYKTVYYDTPDLTFYFKHHNKIARRTKVRIRQYVESDLLFLEVKQKNNKGKTDKSRIRIDQWSDNLGEESLNFIHQITGKHYQLEPTLVNEFNRFTLIDRNKQERATIDLNLRFDSTPFNDHLAIIELKQPSLNRQSPMFQILKEHNVYPEGMSKYCIGVAACQPELKQNNFKKRFRNLEKIKHQ